MVLLILAMIQSTGMSLFFCFNEDKVEICGQIKQTPPRYQSSIKCDDHCADSCRNKPHSVYRYLKNYLIDDCIQIVYEYLFFEGLFHIEDSTSLGEFFDLAKDCTKISEIDVSFSNINLIDCKELLELTYLHKHNLKHFTIRDCRIEYDMDSFLYYVELMKQCKIDCLILHNTINPNVLG